MHEHVVLTADGRAVLEASAPGHVAEVRRVVFDVLDPDDVTELGRLARKVLTVLDDPSRPTR